MLRSHHHLRGFIKLVLWNVHCVNGCGSSMLGYVGIGFEGNCDCRYGILYASMLGSGFCGLFWRHLLLKHTKGMTHLRTHNTHNRQIRINPAGIGPATHRASGHFFRHKIDSVW